MRDNGLTRPSLTSRLKFEVEGLRVLIAKQMIDFQVQRVPKVPEYASLSGCPLD